jgi:hypothetical protein
MEGEWMPPPTFMKKIKLVMCPKCKGEALLSRISLGRFWAWGYFCDTCNRIVGKFLEDE